MYERLLLNKTTGVGILYDDKKNIHLVESERNFEKIPEIIEKENELEVEKQRLIENIGDLKDINNDIKEKYKMFIFSAILEIFLLCLVNFSFSSPSIFLKCYFTLANVAPLTLFQIKHKTFKENYRLKNVTVDLIKSNKNNIKILQTEIEKMKNESDFSKVNILDSSEFEIPKIIYPVDVDENSLSNQTSNGVKIKNYGFIKSQTEEDY